MPRTLDSLPMELLTTICDHVADHRPSLVSVSLVSHKMRTAVAHKLFSIVHMRGPTEADFVRQVLHFPKIAKDNVRQVVVYNFTPQQQWNKSVPWGQHHAQPVPDKTGPDLTPRHSFFGAERLGMFAPEFPSRSTHFLLWPGSIPENTAVTYQLFANVLKELSKLSDLRWKNWDELPGCVLHALHAKSRKPKLHMDIFHFSTLDGLVGPGNLLAISPCLHSMVIRHPDPFSVSRATALTEIMRRFARLAPNLKNIALQAIDEPWDEPNNPYYPQALMRWRQEEQHCKTNRHGKPPMLSLESINIQWFLVGLDSGTHDGAVWVGMNDFSALRALSIDHPLSLASLQFLARNKTLTSLESLSLEWNYALDPLVMEELKHLFQNLGQIASIKKLAVHPRSDLPKGLLQAIIESTGKSLRVLCLHRWDCCSLWFNGVSDDEIYLLRKGLPNLEELTIRINRKFGFPEEVAIYEELGKFPKLKHVSLALDVFAGALCLSKEHKKDYVFAALQETVFLSTVANACLDKYLAHSIYEFINRAKLKTGNRLETLKLKVVGLSTFSSRGGFPRDGAKMRTLEIIGRECQISADLNVDNPHKLHFSRSVVQKARGVVDGHTKALLRSQWPRSEREEPYDWEQYIRGMPHIARY
ncbi:hypothetical protein BT63DRAFT_438073 [Microthyrium microscopicum]|uniref:F-box domain-containing protein n=1 Tax=Microthyrium microscopicum TaxID=703497 RepID=A0A6A6ULA5_9PEZI|nr:hypothetical protein BT63DRAFT_438073 [Microthyrium microscopicum]